MKTPKHYAALNPQPIDVITAWGLGFHDGNALKYIARWRHKGTAAQDLRKAAHYLTMLADGIEKGSLSELSICYSKDGDAYGAITLCGTQRPVRETTVNRKAVTCVNCKAKGSQ